MAPAGLHGVLNDAIAIYLNDATLAGAIVARWYAGVQGRERRRCVLGTGGFVDTAGSARLS